MELLTAIMFYILAAAALSAAVGIILSKRTLYSMLFALVVFLSVAGIYFMLNAPFNATAQIAIYGVGVCLLLVFVIMLTSHKLDAQIYLGFRPSTLLGLVGLGFIFLSTAIFLGIDIGSFIVEPVKNPADTTVLIGMALLKNYVLAFELLSIFLLVVLVGIAAVCVYSGSGSKSGGSSGGKACRK